MKGDYVAIFITVAFLGGYIVGKFSWKPEDITIKYPEVAQVTPTTKVKPVHNIIYQLVASTIECNPDAVNVIINDTHYTMQPNTLSILDWDKGLFEIKTNRDITLRFYDRELEMVWCVQ